MPVAQKTKKLALVYHVVPQKGQWAVRTEAGARVEAAHTRQQAIRAARTLAKGRLGKVVIHSANGRIVARHAYGARSKGQVLRATQDKVPDEQVELFNAVTIAAARSFVK